MTVFSHTWWGERLIEAVERITGEGRLARGRAYAGNGRILSHEIQGTTVQARVRGKINPYFGVYKEPIYHTQFSLTRIEHSAWTDAISHLSSRAGLVTRLLLREMPDTIDEELAEFGVYLLPKSQGDLTSDCSCPDWANPCKHVAGLVYVLAAELDRDPFLLFELRGLQRDDLRRQLEASPLGKILAEDLVEPDVSIEPAASYYTTPVSRPAEAMTCHDFWLGPRRLPNETPAKPPLVPGLLVKRLGDYPAFWHKGASFLDTMDELYGRVRSKSPSLK